MSESLSVEAPSTPVKPPKESIDEDINELSVKVIWPPNKMRILWTALFIGLYIYLVVFVKTEYTRSNRLNRIAEMAKHCQERIIDLRSIDRDLRDEIDYMDEEFM